MTRRPQVFSPRIAFGQPVSEQRLSSRQRGYTADWDKASRHFRLLHPICQYGEEAAFGEEHTAAATRVDHLYPQRRWPAVFWWSELWVSSCDACDAAKQALEHGPIAGLDALALRMRRPTLTQAIAERHDRGGVET